MFEKSTIAVLVPATPELERWPATARAKTETSKGVPKVKGTANVATRFTGSTTLGPEAADQRGFCTEPTDAPGKEHNAPFTATCAPFLWVSTMIDPDPAKPLALIVPLMVTENVITPACPLSVGCVIVKRSLKPASVAACAKNAEFGCVLFARTEITPSRALPEVEDVCDPLVPETAEDAVAAPVNACSLKPAAVPYPTERSAPMSGPLHPHEPVNHADWLKPPGETVVLCFRPAKAAEEIEARATSATVLVGRNMMVTTPMNTGDERFEMVGPPRTTAVHAKTKAPAASLSDVFRLKEPAITVALFAIVGIAPAKRFEGEAKRFESLARRAVSRGKRAVSRFRRPVSRAKRAVSRAKWPVRGAKGAEVSPRIGR